MGPRCARRAGAPRLRGLILTLAVSAFLVARDADGQAALKVAPSVAYTTVFDDNVFVTPDRAEGDVIARLTSGVDMQYERPLMTMTGHYHFDAERFSDHPSLNTVNGRQDAAVDVRSRQFRNVIFGTDATMTATNTPSELNTVSGLAVGRARAARVVAHPSLTWESDPNTSFRLSYSYAFDRLEAGPRAHTQGAGFAMERRRSARQKFAVTYTAERFAFDQAPPILSHVSTLGLETSGRSSSVNVAAGVRLTDSRLSPELSLAARRALRRGELSLGYARTRTTVVGVFGALDTQSLVGAATYDAGRGLRLQAAPGISALTVEDRQAYVFRVALEASVPIGRALALVAASTINSQRARFGDPRWIALSHRVLSVGVRVAPPATRRE
jgi:hypothetical protein